MATLLHIDSSALYENSVSREVTGIFRKEWESQHPGGTVIYRDLAAEPLPHLTEDGIVAALTPVDTHTPAQTEALALRSALADELERADVVVIGTPMYNFSLPSVLKAWIDQVAIVGRTLGETSSVAGKPITVVAARGGGYGPGTPRESYEFLTTYLEKALTGLLGAEVDFIVPELTLARSQPAMADLVDAADASRAKAREDAVVKAKTLAARFAA
ncbi:FMN-dependent NADH-azoreductase [Actinacidiphila acididurans]|uniref:FMN dependent NADH:quinone oxidoreductase n=1 Tax=Actinacidiphila acididurans TaxID=2784346 RepID=A0ABS2TRE1_9ACTN|nr:NAD(P)H-dependent oxidoreductase [Actinacidiphila acididurans]MBM9505907.1 NAD(P)H-dependent oxidoreductase [Actinacidiphila acididurans]